MSCCHLKVILSITFSQRVAVSSLSIGEDGLDVDTHAALGRVSAPHDAEAQPLVSGPLGEPHGQDGEGGAPSSATRQRAKLALLLLLRHLLDQLLGQKACG